MFLIASSGRQAGSRVAVPLMGMSRVFLSLFPFKNDIFPILLSIREDLP